MKRWDYWRRSSAKAPGELISRVCLTLPGWSEDPPREGRRLWLNSDRESLALTVSTRSYPWLERGEELEIRNWARELAKSKSAGLIEVRTIDREINFIVKELIMPTYYYTGILARRVQGMWLFWTTTACELGTTGLREASVTATLMNEGKLSPDEYELHWAQDPYEPAYRGVNRSVLRFMSDDEIYDQQFPQHPLSKVRRMLATLSKHVKYDL